MNVIKHLSWLLPAALLAACSTPQKTTQAPVVEQPKVVIAPPQPQPEITSTAMSPRAYRRDGAEHLYQRNQGRIYRGKMPPLLQAVGVTRISIDYLGRIQAIDWMRAPSHAPSVMAEIERTIRAAEPFPAPVNMGGYGAYVDTWLWDKSGRFQLDTLTEGQLDRR